MKLQPGPKYYIGLRWLIGASHKVSPPDPKPWSKTKKRCDCYCGDPDRQGVAHRSNACLQIGAQRTEYPFPCGFDPMESEAS